MQAQILSKQVANILILQVLLGITCLEICVSCHPNCPTSPPVSPPNTYSASKQAHYCLQVVIACREDYRHCLILTMFNRWHSCTSIICLFSIVVDSVIHKKKKKHMCCLFITVYYRVRYKSTLLETAEAGPTPLNFSSSDNHYTNSWKLRTRIYSLEDLEQNYSLLLYLVPI